MDLPPNLATGPTCLQMSRNSHLRTKKVWFLFIFISWHQRGPSQHSSVPAASRGLVSKCAVLSIPASVGGSASGIFSPEKHNSDPKRSHQACLCLEGERWQVRVETACRGVRAGSKGSFSWKRSPASEACLKLPTCRHFAL